MTNQELHAEMMKAWDGLKDANAARESEIKKFGTELGSTKEKLTKLNDAIDSFETKLASMQAAAQAADEAKTRTDAIQKQLNDLEADVKRKGSTGTGDTKDARVELAMKRKQVLFDELLRKGYRDIKEARGKASAEVVEFVEKQMHEPAVRKALIEGNDVQGGYLAPLEYVNEMLRNVVEWSPVRGIITVRSTTRQGIQIPKRTGTAIARWINETGTRTETTNPKFGMEEIRVHEAYAMTMVSWSELEDSVFNLEAFLRDEFAEQFGLLEGSAIINGTGAGQPEGLLTNADITAVDNGSTSVLNPDKLIEVYYDLKEAYLQNSTWVLNRSTLRVVRQMKDGNGVYLWAPGIRSDARPATILDRPYVTAPDMPQIGSSGANVILFGDFRRGYYAVDRVALDMMVDPYSSKQSGMVEFSARRRVGGQVVIAEALRRLRMQ